MISRVQPHDIPKHWGCISTILERAYDRSMGEVSLDTMFRWAVEGRAQILLIHEKADVAAACAVEMQTYDSGRVLAVRWLAGDGMGVWLDDLMEELFDIARLNGADRIVFAGRKGWRRAMERFGAEPAYTVYKLEIENAKH